MTDPTVPVLAARELVAGYTVPDGFWRARRRVPAVAGIDLSIHPGQTVGVVGESGCGKTTLARTLVGLLRPFSGRIELDGEDISDAGPDRWRQVRRDVQLIFQDPYGSLNPYLTVGELIAEGWRIHPDIAPTQARLAEVGRLLDLVGLRGTDAGRRPGELSGGQRQRVSIARALALRPRVLVCDEAVSALDVSIQAQVLNLLLDLQDDLGISYLFISHDLDVVRHVSAHVLVMYLGTTVESGPNEAVFGNPQHPYTRALLSASPDVTDWQQPDSEIELRGEVPSPATPPSGCRFRTRCYMAQDRCVEEVPALIDPIEGAAGRHPAACHFADGADATAFQSSTGGAR